MNDDILWQTKLAARVHDPAEKALVLLRDPEGHENGTSRSLKRLLGLGELPEHIDPDNADALSRVLFRKGLPRAIYRLVQRADWWAAAADRPQWPVQTIPAKSGGETTRIVDWARVNWARHPILIHPLTGERFDLHDLTETELADIKQRSFAHFAELLVKLGAREEDTRDLRKILFAFWRFGPDLSATGADTEDNGKLGRLWPLLPAETRVPDNSIWDHLDLTSAFAGAFAADPNNEAALLALSIGPVQGFIAAARKMEDLWAGSHLLSRLSWEAMRPVCEALGPDAILFPRLRGIPQVDLWLRDQMGLPDALFVDCDWMQGSTDANPLFSAALPNRFVAVVPASQAKALAERCATAVRAWLLELGEDVVSRLLDAAGFDVETTLTPYEQMKAQLAGFPEVHWAAVPFSLIKPRNAERQRDLDLGALSGAMAPFFGVETGKPCGFLESSAWQVLQKEIDWGDGTAFHAPNPGVLYPAVYDLAERVLAAAKAARPFEQSRQEGWRCTLAGEAEWLTTNKEQLKVPPGSRRDTLWTKVAAKNPSWAKEGEHLAALPAIKRLWPTIFAEEVGRALAAGEKGEQRRVGRFVVSTHTMALAHQLDQWLKKGGLTEGGLDTEHAERVALPRKLILGHRGNPALEDARYVPGLLEAARESDDDAALQQAQRQVRQALAKTLGKDDVRLETYYALLMMDGDRMGAILSGDTRTGTAIAYRASLHPHMQKAFDARAAGHPLIEKYGEQQRPISPNRHLAISGALNDFSQTVARHVVEAEHLGRLIYAGGDDVLAMLPAADLLVCMQRLRDAYSGQLPEDAELDWGKVENEKDKLHCKNGFAFLDGRLMRMMGRQATASCGAVIAHHQAPLSAVLRELRATEKRAKEEGGRDAFAITVVKRSGGALRLAARWGEPLGLLKDMIAFLSDDKVSRRAVYNSLLWIKDLPEPKANPEMLGSLLGYQLARQSNNDPRAQSLARRLTDLAARQERDGLDWISSFLSVAEFLARETRSGVDA